MRSKRLFGLAVSCGLLIAGLLFATPAATPEAEANGPTPTATRASGGSGGSGGDGNGGGGHGG